MVWGITIYRGPPEDYPQNLDRDAVLADWKVGSGGKSWIDELVKRGEARQLKAGGYPDLYTALAGSIAPLLFGEVPPAEEDVPSRMAREITIKRAELALCPADEVLTIAVWDQS